MVSRVHIMYFVHSSSVFSTSHQTIALYSVFIHYSVICLFQQLEKNIAPTTITFARNVDARGATRVITVQISGDTVGEPDETFTVLITPDDLENDESFTQTFTIIDDECKHTYIFCDLFLTLRVQ